ncbi:MAG: SPFH domain-containing protein [Actinobacteria bacterium]|nr:SPFH domain-containing protein [Actinomycetota bacterium]
METSQIGSVLLIILALAFIGWAFWWSFTPIEQATVGVVTMFGKFRRILNPGLNFLIPFIEKVNSKVSIQNRTDQLKFSAITGDQAAVHFTATIIYTVADHLEETVKLVAFKFINPESFLTALTSTVEASVREFVAMKKQAEVLGLRQDIVSHAKTTLDAQLASWGYTLVDLTVNDIAFDSEVMTSMSRVVAATNAQRAAEFEGEALRITLVKRAEAEGAAIRITATNEAEAARMRGEGLAQFRKALAEGLGESAEVLEKHNIDPTILAFSMWTEMIRDTAKEGRGNTIFLDGGIENLDDSLRRLQAMVSKPSSEIKRQSEK